MLRAEQKRATQPIGCRPQHVSRDAARVCVACARNVRAWSGARLLGFYSSTGRHLTGIRVCAPSRVGSVSRARGCCCRNVEPNIATIANLPYRPAPTPRPGSAGHFRSSIVFPVCILLVVQDSPWRPRSDTRQHDSCSPLAGCYLSLQANRVLREQSSQGFGQIMLYMLSFIGSFSDVGFSSIWYIHYSLGNLKELETSPNWKFR